MTRRRKSIAAAAVASIVLLLVGLGAHRYRRAPSTAQRESCEKNLSQVFEWCGQGKGNFCEKASAEFAEACQAGCVKGLCPAQVTCTELDPIWCTPCEDMHGATFWEYREAVAAYCDVESRGIFGEYNRKAFDACFVAESERRCPALSGMGWEARANAANPWLSSWVY